MNSFRFSDLKVGHTEAFTVEVDEKAMQAFLEISGDNNPLHVDTEVARARGFQNRVVYGMLSSSFYSCLVGVHLPGKNCLLQGIEITFLSPVYIGDRLTVQGEIVFLNEAYRFAEIKAVITNQSGQKVSRAKIKVGLHE